MLANLKLRLTDAETIKKVLLAAEASAHAEGATEPGSEHMVMAALALQDDTARRAFLRVGATPRDFAPAVARQYADALIRIGMGGGVNFLDYQPPPARRPLTKLFKGKPSAQTLMRTMARARAVQPSRPLMGADIVLAALSSDVGVVARALAVMGIDPDKLADACRLELAACGGKR